MSYDRLVENVSISSDGRILDVGAIGDDENGGNYGPVSVHTYNDNYWVQLGQDIYGESAYYLSRSSVFISSDGRTLVVADFYIDVIHGTNYVHVRLNIYTNNYWVQIGQEIDVEISQDWFGDSIAISGDYGTVAFGDIFNDEKGNIYRHVIVHNYNDYSWVQPGKYIYWKVQLTSQGILLLSRVT